MNVIHGSSKTLARALRNAGPSVLLKSRNAAGLRKRRYDTKLFRWDEVPPGTQADWNRDIFLAYPDTNRVTNAPSDYAKLVEFYRGNKYEQWQVLKDFFMCPEFKDAPFVKRPLRHEGGQGFEIINDKPEADHNSTHYFRSLFERSAEYRVFFAHGKKVLTLLKRVAPGTRQDIPWNHGVSSFVTVHDANHDRLRHSKFYEKAESFFKAYPFHLCAVDVLYRKQRHRVVEVNFSPGVLIEENLRSITSAILSRPNACSNNQTVRAPIAVATS